MRVAFIIWNSFQLLHFKPLLKALPKALLIIEKRKKFQKINTSLLNDLVNNITYLKSKDIFRKIEGNFDLLVAQTVFEKVHLFSKTKLVFLQYGYAKEPYNYSTWRALADLNLVYGQYAYDRISYFSPTEITGCPRYDSWFQKELHKDSENKYNNIIDKNKKTLLYAPSWGELSSFELYIDAIYQLCQNYNVLVKLHHNTLLLNKNQIKYKEIYPNIHFFYQDEDILSLISISDLVISDYSGAIFDALFCKKNVVLLSIPDLIHNKIDNFSIEIHNRNQLGYVVNHPNELLEVINAINFNQYSINELYSSLFLETQNATENVINALTKLCNGYYKPSQQQLYLKKTIKDFYREKSQHDLAKRKAPFKKISRFFATLYKLGKRHEKGSHIRNI